MKLGPELTVMCRVCMFLSFEGKFFSVFRVYIKNIHINFEKRQAHLGRYWDISWLKIMNK